MKYNFKVKKYSRETTPESRKSNKQNYASNHSNNTLRINTTS